MTAQAPTRRTAQTARVCGELLLTLGVVVALYLVYELYGTGIATQHAQQQASEQLERAWAQPPAADQGLAGADGGQPAVTPGTPIARIRIPALGDDWSYTVLEGTDQDVLAHGPGHYTGTPMPGEPGNAAIAGHRVGRGAPFDALDNIRSCDPILVETRTGWLTYRVLPIAGAPASEHAGPDCATLPTLEDRYAQVSGREVVLPSQTEVIATVPDDPALAPERPERLLTLTTCNPRFSARQRLIIHAVLTDTTAKPVGATPQ